MDKIITGRDLMMDLWTLQDVESFKEVSSKEYRQAEKAVYDLLGEFQQVLDNSLLPPPQRQISQSLTQSTI